MVAPRWHVEAGTSFKGAGGEVRHVISTKRDPHGGSTVSWDSVPLSNEYFSDAQISLRKSRPNGVMSMRGFQEWVVEQVAP